MGGIYVCSALYIGIAAAVILRCRADAESEAAQTALAAATVEYDEALLAWETATGDELIYFGLLSRRR
jgi:hypothetical protein